jgi:hypothetical protein
MIRGAIVKQFARFLGAISGGIKYIVSRNAELPGKRDAMYSGPHK